MSSGRETGSGESVGVTFENRSGADIRSVSTGSAERRVKWPPEQVSSLASPGPGADNNPMDVLTAPLTLTVNGEPLLLEGAATVAGLLAHLKFDTRKIAVELNREIVPRSTYATTELKSGDTLEIVHFIGGG